MNKAVFWDKDGTLIPDIPYNVDPARITLYPDAGDSLYRLKTAGYKLIIISNQSGVARGRFTENDLAGVWERLTRLLAPFGAEPDGFYYCPHDPNGSVQPYAGSCLCRKPEPGLLMKAAQEHRIDLSQSWMVGDILNDVEAGNRAGCRTILLDRGNETEWLMNAHRQPTTTAATLSEATEYMLRETARCTRQQDAV
ncbi:D-glycero-alpha-D-manno-heptose-1,7-bisphosphate 7-phosphatase [Spirosoma radiotolerans]|uniref:D,D-heptose 1,7-bisphosphate phosphatase n=1 Tax=Spirosoma radiotolerans TaxID=1379870 RepID=A0A0E3ZTF0_9BACT|nr:HAD family hydrolase [Spirosoma radiotolerans]AKD54000.1 HAD family hydrolase [Spirosoma radiotolerans]